MIAIVGEFDALPGLSQEAQTANHHAIEENAPGHGCGHNLLGTGALASAVAVKEWLAASGHAGTLRYCGTAAEEGGSGKVHMVRDGFGDGFSYVVGLGSIESKAQRVAANGRPLDLTPGRNVSRGAAPGDA